MPKPAEKPREHYYARDRKEWRSWLEKHHATSTGVWLIAYKQHTAQLSVDYPDAVEEALCFGWVDSRPNVLDEERFMRLFSPRKPKSPWSRLNKQRVEKLIQQGLMTEAGLNVIEAAKRDGFWNLYDAIENLALPEDLKNALAANPTASHYFEAFSPSVKKSILWWIESVKRPQTREKRIEETVRLAAMNIKANQYRQ